ncbi:hypothetical protein A8U91_01467 [Halomonas elongata]|uniref:Uncharacterized protein n=1 Tax=Halomonas elongata TaxID=2746 RepID=A0A1B8P4F4_HALEL|nr:hypothetical protein A8U91_01467 [Halomonas elongata]
MSLPATLYRNLITYFLTILSPCHAASLEARTILNFLEIRHYHFLHLACIIHSRYFTIMISHQSLITE